ncbi:MAG: hypothetical protein IPJ61_21460 [Tessaracoccus sp.]|uniref:hypothetical protein n=1 Tax=Tessaracoccus sp. TaxID=1971211 RepID=UPI001EC2EFF0|nr:hypothetical protein [Tessaracoccus sp.]MBK7823557.1 hypothetical protein [Tessaracoccus sp.]
MATLPAVKLEMLLNGSWVDMAATPARLDGATPQSRVLWSESGGPVQIVRGVSDEGGTATGTLDCVLENNDGALTPEKATSPFYPYLTKGRQIRFSTYYASAWHQRFGGYVWAEPLTWTNEVGTACNVSISAIDAIGMAYKPLRSVAVEATAARSPIGYWPLTDSESTQAADESGNNRPALAVQQWKTGGEIGWAAGAVLPTDNVGGLTLTPASDSGIYLRSATGIDLPAAWALTVFPTPAAKDGYLCQIGNDSYSIGIWYDTASKKFSAIETMLDSSGDPIDYVLSTSTSAITPGVMESVVVTATTVKLGSSGTTGTRHNSDTMLGSLVSVGGAFAVESGRARMYSGEVKHLGLWGGVGPGGLASDVTNGPAAMFMMSTAIATVMGWSGLTETVSTLGTDQPVQLLKTEGLSAAEILDQYARGSMARIFCGGDGNIVVSAWDYYPTPITAPSGDIDPALEWGADVDGAIAGAKMTFPDGSVYSTGTGELELPGVLSAENGRDVTDWRVLSGGGMPRFPDATYHLLNLSDAEAAALALADVGSVLVVPGLPGQLPSSSQSGIADSLVETYGADVWDMEFTTSPDPRDDLLIVGDATRGVVGSGRMAGPLGPVIPSEGTVRAGDEIDAALLNGVAYAGVEIRTGSLSITPVANTPTSVAVTFTPAYAVAPTAVVLTPATGAINEIQGLGVTAIGTTGFTAWIYRTNTTATTLWWAAS